MHEGPVLTYLAPSDRPRGRSMSVTPFIDSVLEIARAAGREILDVVL